VRAAAIIFVTGALVVAAGFAMLVVALLL